MLNFERVYKNYDGRKHVLRDLNFTIETGEFVYLVGPSGAGKTTLFRILCLSETVTSGSVRWEGKDIKSWAASEKRKYRSHLGVVFQDYQLVPYRSVFENIALPLEIRGLSDSEVQSKVSRIAEEVGISELLRSYPDQISGGEQQRVSIARALVTEPRIVIADEPTGNLDPKLGRQIVSLFESFNQRGATVIMATHDLALVAERPSRTIDLGLGLA